MNDQKHPFSPDIPSPANPTLSRADRKAATLKVPSQEVAQIINLHRNGYGTREIALRVRRDRKTIRRVLLREGLLSSLPAPASPSKLEPYHEAVRQKVDKNLTATRILREIREDGYSGGRTILANYVRSIRSPLASSRAVKRRFETRAGEELQADWAVYTVPIARKPTRVHALACLLAYSRKAHVRFYRDERQSTLLEALALALEAFEGCALRVVFDNMATVVLGRIGPGRKPLWHPRFLDFARHYGFEPFACRVRHPDRKGKTERFLDFLEKDFVRGAEFSSFEDLNRRVQTWTDQIANRRVHGTTRLVPDEAWQTERELLIRPPEKRFAVYQEEVRQVGPDATLSIGGTLYTIPAQPKPHSARVRLYAEHFEVLNKNDAVVFSQRYVEDEDKGRLQLDPNHYAALPHLPPNVPSARIGEAFLERFPTLAGLVEGIALRMKSISHIHLRSLWRLADLYGQESFLRAAAHAQDHRRFNAEAVRRILERANPLPDQPAEILPLDASSRALALLTDVDPGSLDNYSHLDSDRASATQPATGDLPAAEPASPPIPPQDEEEPHDS